MYSLDEVPLAPVEWPHAVQLPSSRKTSRWGPGREGHVSPNSKHTVPAFGESVELAR